MYVDVKRPLTSRLDELIARVRSEYREMPGLSLTLAQAQRLWSLDHATCVTLFERLVQMRVLRTTRRGRYVRAEGSGAVASGEPFG